MMNDFSKFSKIPLLLPSPSHTNWLPTCQKLLDNFENFRILWGAPYPSFWHNINEITIGAGKRKVKTLSNECGVKSERLVVIYCFLLPSDVSTRVPISGCRFSYHSHFSRHSQTTIVPLATRGAIFSQKKHSTLYLKMTRVKILLLLLFVSPFLTRAAPSINPEER